MSLFQLLENRIIPRISLSKYDESWRNVIDGSVLFGFWQKFKTLFPQSQTLARVFELISFLLVLVLFAVLPAPQFADDKGLLAVLVFAACLIRLLASCFSKEASYNPSALDLLVIAFVFMNIIATAASHYLLPSLKGLAKMAVYFMSYFLFASVLQKSTAKRSKFVLASVLGSALLVSLYGIYQYKIGVAPLATWEDPTVEEKTTRVYSTLKNPNLLAGYLVPLIPLSFALSISGLFEKGWKKLLTLPLGFTALCITVCCVFTGSRGGYLGIGAGFAALGLTIFTSIWSAKARLRPWLLLLLFVLPVLLVLALHQFPSYEHRILSIFAGREHSSNSYRLNVYIASFKMFLDSWWLGVGPGNSTFKLAYGLYMRSGFDALGTYCVPLEVAVETGIVGLAIFIFLIIGGMARAHQHFWASRGSAMRWLSAGAAAGLVAMMVHGLVDTVYYRPQVQFIFWLLLALCLRNPCSGTAERQK